MFPRFQRTPRRSGLRLVTTRPKSAFRGGYETSRRPRTAPPELPSQPTTGNVAHADLSKLRLVLPSAPNVGDHQPTARTQYPHRFVNCFLPASPSTDVVDRQTGDDQIKAVVCKGQRRHVAGVQFDSICYALSDGVTPGSLGRIARLIDASPQVHAHRPACGQALSGHQQNRTPATSQVQDALVAPKVQLVEQVGPNHEFASKRAVK